MPETPAQRAERRRRGEEAAKLKFDGFDDVRAARRRRAALDSGRTGRSSSPEAIGTGKRRALERYAANNGLTMDELQKVRAEMLRRNGGLLVRTSPAASCLCR